MEPAEGNYMEAIKGVLVKRSPNELLCGTPRFLFKKNARGALTVSSVSMA